MKSLFFVFLILLSIQSKAAEIVICQSTDGHKLILTKIDNVEREVFRLDLDEELSSSYLGAIEGRKVSKEPSKTADYIYDWDGNSGISLTMRLGFLSEPVGTMTKAFVKVYYNDINQDRVTHPLHCRIIK